LVDGAIEGTLCVGPADVPLQWDAQILSGADTTDGGHFAARISADPVTEPVICACFGVGVDAVRKALAGGTVRTVAEIGEALRAGTNCGSCLPELKRMIVHERITHPN
jgi:assimilatory nitrate reductase catalytic subunit